MYLREATIKYSESLPGSPADEYLETRGLTGPSIRPRVDKFRLGYVADPLPGHDMYRGMLAVPYLRRAENGDWSVVSIRFRCIEDHDHKGHGKYMTVSGDRPRMFNTLSLMTPSDTVCVCEGEIDAITAFACGLDAVGIPGATSWQPHFRAPFLGYETVYVLADGDDAGMKFAHTVASSLPNAKIIPFPPGEDVNSVVLSKGPSELLEKVCKP